MKNIGILYEKVEEIVNEFDSIKNGIIVSEKEIQDIEEVIANPALLNEKPSLKYYLSGERHNNLSNINYLRITSLVEDYDPNLLEIEQIKETYDVLKDLLEKRKAFYEERLEKYREIIDKESITISVLTDFKSIVARYSPYTYINKDEKDTIDRAFEIFMTKISDDDRTVDLFQKLYFEIADNNSRLETPIREEILERKARSREQEALERITRAKHSLIAETEAVEETNERDEYYVKLRNTDYYQNIESIKDRIDEKIYKKLVILGNEYKKSLETLTDTLVDDIITIEKLFDPNVDMYDFIDNYKGILSEKNISIVIVKKLNDLIKENKLDELEDSINDTKVAIMNVLSNEDFLEYNDYSQFLELFNNIKDNVNQNGIDIEKIQRVELSASELSEEERDKYLDDNKVSKEEYYEYQLIKTLKELKLDIAEYGTIDSGEIEKKYNELAGIYKDYESHRKKIGEPIEDKKTLEERLNDFNKNPYSEYFENYVAFLVPEDLKTTINKYVELSESETANKINFIIKTELATLLKGGSGKSHKDAVSSPIMIAPNTENSYGIRELKKGGRESRLGFKVGHNKFNDKNVIMIITTARGKNSSTKSDELKRNISLFEERMDYYEKIEEMLDKYNKLNELNEEERKEQNKQKEYEEAKSFVENLIVEGIKVYNDFIVGDGVVPPTEIEQNTPEGLGTSGKKMGGNV